MYWSMVCSSPHVLVYGVFETFPSGNGPNVLNTFFTAGGSKGAPIGDTRLYGGGGDDFTYVSGDQLGMLVHTI